MLNSSAEMAAASEDEPASAVVLTFVLLELRLLLDEVDDDDEAELLVLVGHFLIGTESESSESSLVLSSVAMDSDEMSVLLEVRRREEECG